MSSRPCIARSPVNQRDSNLMRKDWIDIRSEEVAQASAEEFWAVMRTESDAGEFWADRIKRYRGEPKKRLALALKHLPLPAAFREAAIAIRALVRVSRGAGAPVQKELSLLYRLAAVRSFMLDYAPRLQEPGFNVVEATPGHLVWSLPYTYSELGYRNLSLLNKTDVKWLIEAWGEPHSHTILHAIHRSVWDEYETKLMQRRRRRLNKMGPLGQ